MSAISTPEHLLARFRAEGGLDIPARWASVPREPSVSLNPLPRNQGDYLRRPGERWVRWAAPSVSTLSPAPITAPTPFRSHSRYRGHFRTIGASPLTARGAACALLAFPPE